MEEVWKNIHGFEGIYQASNLGRIKSLSRYTKRKSAKGNHYLRLEKEKILKPYLANGGYESVALRNNRHCLIHRLVFLAFNGNLPDGNKLQIDHKDNNKLNNRLDNLQILTRDENVRKGCSNMDKTSKYNNVSYHKATNKWRAYYKGKHLGLYTTEEEANLAFTNFIGQN